MVKQVCLMLTLLLMMGVVGCATSAAMQSYPSFPSDPIREASMMDDDWLSPPEVPIVNFFPGARLGWYMRIHNGSSKPATFLVSYMEPTDVAEGYDRPLPNASDWVVIADSMPVLAPKETKEVLVVLAIPKGVKVDSAKWEFWIAVMKQGQGQIRSRTAARCLVQMR